MAIGEFMVSAITKIGGVMLTSLVKDSISEDSTGYTLLREGLGEAINISSEAGATKVRDFFFKPQTFKKKYEHILIETFKECNESFDGAFSGYIDYLHNFDGSIISLEDSLREWNCNSNVSIVSTLNDSLIKAFAKSYFLIMKKRIESDELLYQYLSILKMVQNTNELICSLDKMQESITDLANREDLNNLVDEIKKLQECGAESITTFTAQVTQKALGERNEIGDIEVDKKISKGVISIDQTTIGNDNKIGGIKIHSN